MAKSNPVIKNRNLKIIFSITLVGVMGVATITPVLPDIAHELDIKKGNIGLLITVFAFPGIFLSPVIGVFADRFGRKAILVPALMLFAVAGTSCFFVENFRGLLIMRFFQGIGAAAIGTLNITLIGDIFEGNRRAEAMGYNSSVLSSATALYPAIGGGLAVFGWNMPFLLPAVAFFVALFVLFKLDNPEPKKQENLLDYFKGALGKMNSCLIIMLFLLTFSTFLLLFGSILTYVPILMKERFGFASGKLGITLSLFSLSTGLVATQLGRLNRLFNTKWLIVIGFTTYLLVFLLLPSIDRLVWFAVPLIFFGFGQGINLPSVLNLISAVAPIEYRAVFLSINSMMQRAGQTLGPIIMGALYGINEIDLVFRGSAVLAFVFAVLIIILLPSDVGKQTS